MLRSGLIATKIGNSSYYHEDGKNTHVTVLKVDECIVASVKTSAKDGYNAVQLASVDTEKDISHINKPQRKIFSSINIKPKKIVKEFRVDNDNILEVGTYDGFNALLLSKLFPNSKIFTIDLPEDDKDFIASYKRKNQLIEFIENRKKNLSLGDNIEFIPMNSIKLINYKKKYDLIWIDGAHGYPILPIDISNSIRMISKNGVIMCDDIFTSPLTL